MAQGSILEGVFAINKPMGMSSAQVIRDCQDYFNPSRAFAPLLDHEREERHKESKTSRRRRSKAKRDIRVKMGHGGTLDPLATGVLILGVGKGTKSLSNFLQCTKTYETVVLFGASTDTYDRVGRILKKRPYDDVTEQSVRDALGSFRGKFKQMPPLYSALKMEGKPLYEYAREGKPIPREIATRDVEVSELELLEWCEPGSHNYRWPTEEAGTAEQTLADQVWRAEKQQAEGKTFTPEQEIEEDKAWAAHESFKKESEEAQDKLVQEKPSKKRKAEQRETPMMSGALGSLPPAGKGSNLVPPPPAANTPPPWEGKGPPAAKFRLTVTSGFYIRSFCHDLGEKVGSAAMMAELCRSRQGDFTLGGPNCLEYTDLAKGEDSWAPKVAGMLSSWNNGKFGREIAPGSPTKHPNPRSSTVAANVQETVEGGQDNVFVPPAKRQKLQESTKVAESAETEAMELCHKESRQEPPPENVDASAQETIQETIEKEGQQRPAAESETKQNGAGNSSEKLEADSAS